VENFYGENAARTPNGVDVDLCLEFSFYVSLLTKACRSTVRFSSTFSSNYGNNPPNHRAAC
jgi:hypothetical protein